MTTAYFDCFSGAAGDMIVASLLDAGADAAALRAGLESLGVSGYEVAIEQITKQGMAATRFDVRLEADAQQPHRHLKDILKILDSSALAPSVRDRASLIFRRLAEAEAKVHGTSVEQVHFHEVGAVDAIVDVVGAVLALDLLGVDRILCSPVVTGFGTVKCAHGVMPVPAPATAELLTGVPTIAGDVEGEWTTPTGAAVLTTLATSFGPMPGMTVEQIGYGAGSRDRPGGLNALRVLIGTCEIDEAGEADEVAVLETNIDDASPEIVGHCLARLLSAGALDVYAVPIQMKKSRTGVVLTVLCEPKQTNAMEDILFAETTTFGIRRHHMQRTKLRRRFEKVLTPYGPVNVKIGERGDIVTVSPEYDDCQVAATKHGVSLREVQDAARRAWEA